MAVIFAISRDWGFMPVRLPLSRPHIPALIDVTRQSQRGEGGARLARAWRRAVERSL